MESRVKLLGHALHQQLIPLPLGLLPASVVFDIIALVTRDPMFYRVAFWLVGAGVATGLLAALFGTIDWVAIPAGTRAKAVGMYHMVTNVAGITLFAIGWVLRRDALAAEPVSIAVIPILLSVIALGINLVAAWFGGELVDRLGVGVDEGAHLDAPSSLSDRPAATAENPAG